MKFYKEDIKYIRRTSWSGFYTYEHQYHFSIRGESSNYIINKYDLFGGDVELHYFSDDYITVTSKNPKSRFQESDVAEIDNEDIDELLAILQEHIKEDQRNWEEYKCNDDYIWDTRWEK